MEYVRHLIFDVLDETEQHALRGALTKIMSKLIGRCELTETWPPPARYQASLDIRDRLAAAHPADTNGSTKRQPTDRRTRPRVRV